MYLQFSKVCEIWVLLSATEWVLHCGADFACSLFCQIRTAQSSLGLMVNNPPVAFIWMDVFHFCTPWFLFRPRFFFSFSSLKLLYQSRHFLLPLTWNKDAPCGFYLDRVFLLLLFEVFIQTVFLPAACGMVIHRVKFLFLLLFLLLGHFNFNTNFQSHWGQLNGFFIIVPIFM